MHSRHDKGTETNEVGIFFDDGSSIVQGSVVKELAELQEFLLAMSFWVVLWMH